MATRPIPTLPFRDTVNPLAVTTELSAVVKSRPSAAATADFTAVRLAAATVQPLRRRLKDADCRSVSVVERSSDRAGSI